MTLDVKVLTIQHDKLQDIRFDLTDCNNNTRASSKLMTIVANKLCHGTTENGYS